jgi:iron-sulfur cluster repair protein YtfE (RIC family)
VSHLLIEVEQVCESAANSKEANQGVPRITEPLREEHRGLLPHIEALREAGDAVSRSDAAAVREKLEHAYAFLSNDLIPHATAEDEALYPVVARSMGSEVATKTMSRDHVEVGRLTEELGRLREQIGIGILDEAKRNELRRVLYGLFTLVSVHFAKEEEVYLPLLDERLDESGAREMFEAMETAAAKARQHL